jgi:hypothetical protein
MSDRPTDAEREALIASARGDALDPEEAADVSLLAELLADPSTWANPPADLEGDVVRAVQDAPAAPAKGSPRRAADTRRRRLAAWAVSGVAAAAVVVVALLIATSLGNDSTTQFALELNGTELAQGARASGEVRSTDSGFRITLDAEGLPPLGDGEFYQAWLKNAAGTLVPIGTFSSSDDQVTLWSGVSPDEYSTMTVTIEAADNQQGSSGRRVLEGPVVAE